MPKHIFCVFTNPVPGKENEYNAWYEDHINQILSLRGFAAAQRFKFNPARQRPGAPPNPYQYLAIYELDDVKVAMNSLAKIIATGNFPPPPKELCHPQRGEAVFDAAGRRKLAKRAKK